MPHTWVLRGFSCTCDHTSASRWPDRHDPEPSNRSVRLNTQRSTFTTDLTNTNPIILLRLRRHGIHSFRRNPPQSSTRVRIAMGRHSVHISRCARVSERPSRKYIRNIHLLICLPTHINCSFRPAVDVFDSDNHAACSTPIVKS